LITGRYSQLQLPRLADEIMTETVMRLCVYQPVSLLLIDVPGGDQDAVRPQGDLAVADLAREPGAFLNEPATDPQPAGLRLDEQESQLGHVGMLGMFDQEDRADVLAASF